MLTTKEATATHSSCTATREQPCSLQLEKSLHSSETQHSQKCIDIKKIYTEVASETYDVHTKYDDVVDLDKEKLVLMHFNTMELYNRAKEDGFEVGSTTTNVNPHLKDYEVMGLAIKYYQNYR